MEINEKELSLLWMRTAPDLSFNKFVETKLELGIDEECTILEKWPSWYWRQKGLKSTSDNKTPKAVVTTFNNSIFAEKK